MIRLFEMFAGYGGASFALEKAEIQHIKVGFSEIDKYAKQCYNQNHYEVIEYEGACVNNYVEDFGDCTKIDPEKLPNFDLLTGGFPCQSFSIAGKGLGELDTRGTLFNEIIRIAEAKYPKYMLLENVKGLTTKKHKDTFNKILSELDRIGYNVQWKVLNSKDYGIPQNRERVFFMCVRKDIEQNHAWPEKQELNLKLKDLLEDNPDNKYNFTEKNLNHYQREFGSKGKVMLGEQISPTLTTAMGSGGGNIPAIDKKYYLKPEQVERLIKSTWKSKKPEGEISTRIQSRDYKDPKIIQLNNPKHSNDRVYSSEGDTPSLNTMQGGNRQPFIQIKNATKQGYLEAFEGDGVNLEQPNSATPRGRVQDQSAPTLQCNDARGVVCLSYMNNTASENAHCLLGNDHNVVHRIYDGLTIRKLTPKECFRLMGFLDDQINLDGISDSQKYKLAGNGWDINLVSKIFEAWLK